MRGPFKQRVNGDKKENIKAHLGRQLLDRVKDKDSSQSRIFCLPNRCMFRDLYKNRTFHCQISPNDVIE